METHSSEKKQPACISNKSAKHKSSENIKKLKERIIQTNQLLNLFKTKEKELAQYKESIALLEQNQTKSKAQLALLNKEIEVFRKAAQQFRTEAENLKQELDQKDIQLKDHSTMTIEIKRLRSENDKLGKRVKSLEILKDQLEFKVQESDATNDMRENQKKEISRLKKELEKKDELCKKSQSAKEILDTKVKKLQKEVDNLNELLLEYKSETNTLRDEKNEKDTIIESLNQQLEDLSHQATNVDELNQDINELKIQIQAAHDENIKKQRECSQHSKALCKLKRQNTSIEELKRENLDLQNKLQEAHKQISNMCNENNRSGNAIHEESNTSQHVIVLRALQDLVTSQQVEILQLQTSRKSDAFARVNAIEALYSKPASAILQDQSFQTSSVCDATVSPITDNTEIGSNSSTVADAENLISQVKEINRTIVPQRKVSQIKKKSIDQPSAKTKLIEEKNQGRKRKSLDKTISSSPNMNPKIKTDSLKRRKTIIKPRTKLKVTEILSHIDDLAFIKEKLFDFGCPSQEAIRSIDVFRQFAFEKSPVLFQAVDELLHYIDTPLYLGDIYNNDQLKIYTRANSLSIQLPAVLPSKETNVILFLWLLFVEFPSSKLIDKMLLWTNEKIMVAGILGEPLDLAIINDIQRARTLCYDIMREKTNNDSIHYFMENTARIWPNVLMVSINNRKLESFKIDESFVIRTIESIIAGIVLEKMHDESVYKLYNTFVRLCSWDEPHQAPFLKEILQYLAEILNSEEFHNKCCNEYDQEKFQEYRFNLVKSFELAACWWCWDDVHSRYVSKILWPLVKNEKGKDIPLEIIGAVCRPRLFEQTEKEGVAEIRRRMKSALNPHSPVSFLLQVQSAQVLIKLANGDPRHYRDILSWYLRLENDKVQRLPRLFINDLEYMRSFS
ncbi:13544_t:CDS:10 [Dentiscutata erythropus]|uniref:13544_t:CDS:1 n=1 Tax=Dentiscutata erythropus TaxID=1348616 RepID=A0A9N8ZAG9_9GLOM|nr:13544_t:CDS:10 [Dentiscutata erythropus]